MNKSVKPNSSITQLSLSQSMMVLSKSKTTTILLDIFVLWEEWFTRNRRKMDEEKEKEKGIYRQDQKKKKESLEYYIASS